MWVLYFSPTPLTCREIAERLNLPVVNINKQMCMYQKYKLRYFRKLKKREGERAHRYTITRRGMKYFIRYCYMLHEGFSLNLKLRIPKRMPKRERILQQRKDDADRRRAEFERTGVYQQEPRKSTWQDWINISLEDLKDYTGVKSNQIQPEITPNGI